jgi:nucleotide-binding universal stress UspA family protein
MPDLIIVGTDGSEAANVAVEWAADDALRMHALLRIVSAVSRLPYEFPVPELDAAKAKNAIDALGTAEEIARTRQPDIQVSTQLVEGDPAKTLRDQSEEATEIVIGSRGLGGFAGMLLGSVSTNVAAHAHCPVVVTRREQHITYGEIVVGVAGSDDCENALGYAFEQARLRGSRLHAIHAWELPYIGSMISYELNDVRAAEERVADDRLTSWLERFPDVAVTKEVTSAHPVKALTEASAHCDLLVVGSHRRGSLRSALLGSVSRGVLHHARCAVAVVRT